MMPGDKLSAEEIHARVQSFWELSETNFGPVPLPGLMRCPVCGVDDKDILIQHWRFHEKTGPSRVRYRCDVGFKCTICSNVWIHGVPIPTWYWSTNSVRVGTRVYWREAETIMAKRFPK